MIIARCIVRPRPVSNSDLVVRVDLQGGIILLMECTNYRQLFGLSRCGKSGVKDIRCDLSLALDDASEALRKR